MKNVKLYSENHYNYTLYTPCSKGLLQNLPPCYILFINHSHINPVFISKQNIYWGFFDKIALLGVKMAEKNLTQGQLEASRHFTGPALTLAIPGSGKTTLLLHRLIHLVEHHQVSPDSILTLTFSKASADDMERRYRSTFPEGAPFQFMTIHRLAFRMYKSYLNAIGKEMTLLEDGSQKYRILNEVYRKRHHESLSEDDFETLSNQIGLIYNLRLNRNQSHDQTFDWDDIFEMAEDYHKYKKNHLLFDFDDMLISAIQLLKKSPQYRKNLVDQYRFIQVDEAQDTSLLQFELIELLLSDENNLFLVADDDQSIYGFRGAYPRYLLDFKKRFEDANLYYLDQNFRSDAHIVTAAAEIIAHNKDRYPKKMMPFFSPIEEPVVRVFDDLIGRNAYLKACFNEAQDQKQTLAVLYRNKISAISIIDLLEKEKMSFQIKDMPHAELSHWLLEDLLAFITLAMIPQDFQSFSRIAFKTNGFISREMLNYIQLNQRGRNLFNVLVEIPFLQDYQTRTQERLKEQFEALSKLRPYDAIHFIETELGYLEYIKNSSSKLGFTMTYARTRLDTYKAIAKPLKTGFDFINRIDTLRKFLMSNQGNIDERITLSTIHGSKGLEFDEVYMVDVNPQVFPNAKNRTDAQIEEERRLFYVGLTRAKKRFELLHSEFINGAFNANSKFIDELLSQPITQHRFNNVSGKSATG